MEINDTLQERGKRYGEFSGHARITQNIKRAMQDSANWAVLADDQRETLEMIAHKIGRILNGDADYHDSWHDIVGYTKLVADRLALVVETFAPLQDVFTLQEIEEVIADLRQENLDADHFPSAPKMVQVTELTFAEAVHAREMREWLENDDAEVVA